MPKVKHGRRHNHYRIKNSERLSTRKVLQDTVNIGDCSAELPSETANIHTESPSFNFFDKLQSFQLENWHVYHSAECVELSLLQNCPPQPSVVKLTLTIYKNLHWAVRLYGRLLTAREFLNKHPITITSVVQLEGLCHSLTTMNICSGNSDEPS